MNTIEATYINALLADASYVRVSEGIDSELMKTRVTEAQVAFIAANFQVRASIETPNTINPLLGTGFDAVVWEGKSGTPYAGQVYVSMRGTQGGTDIADDVTLATKGIPYDQIRDMVNWWLQNTASPTDTSVVQIRVADIPGQVIGKTFALGTPTTGTGLLAELGPITGVNGHSLGGYLATAFTRLFGNAWDVQTVKTFNSAGFSNLMTSNTDGEFLNIASMIGADKGLGTWGAVGAKQTNYYAQNGWSMTTNDWGEMGFLMPGFNQYGERVGLSQEEGFADANHSMYRLTDVLALGAALEKLDPDFNIGQLDALMPAGSNQAAGSIEGLFDGLRRAIEGPGIAPSLVGDAKDSEAYRVEYHEALAQFINKDHTNLAGHLQISSASTGLATQARNDFAAIVALQDLSPIVVRGKDAGGQAILEGLWQVTRAADYAAWQADMSAATPSTFTDQWLKDRADMLDTLTKRNIADIPDGARLPDTRNVHFLDKASGTDIPVGIDSLRAHILFGGAGDDTDLVGAGGEDHLYGGAGNDTLSGMAGNDYLEGGSGADQLEGGAGNDRLWGGSDYDTYVFTGAFGKDEVSDSDGQGAILIDGQAIGVARGAGKAGVWVAKAGDQDVGLAVYDDSSSATGKSLVITRAGSTADTITIRDFDLADAQDLDKGYLGIKLDPKARVAIKEGREADNPFGQAGFDAATLGGSSSMAEGAGKLYTVYLDQPAKAGDTLTLNLSGSGAGQFMCQREDASVPANGAVLTLAEGQSEYSFMLMQVGDVAADIQASIAVTYADGDSATPDVLSNAWGVSASAASGVYALQGGYFVPGSARLPNAPWQLQPDGSIDGVAPLYESNDLMIGWQDSLTQPGTYDRVSGYDGQSLVIEHTQALDLRGLGGNDFISGEQYDDRLDGGDGDDLIWGGAGSDVILGGAGNDVIVSNMAATYLDDAAEIPTPAGYTRGADTVISYEGDPAYAQGRWWVERSDSGDSLRIQRAYVKNPDGSYTYWAENESDHDFVDAGDGDDYVWGGRGADTLIGGNGDDHLAGLGGADVLLGGAGKDVIHGDAWWAMRLTVAASHDATNYYTDVLPLDEALKNPALHGDDVIDAGAGDDQVWGDGGNDLILGGEGDDLLIGDADPGELPVEYHGDDTLDGGEGNDVLIGGGGNDVLRGGAGDDELQGDSSGLAGQDHGDDYLDGGAGNDLLFGQGGNDTLMGGEGNDQLVGDALPEDLPGAYHGNDTLDGGEGDDVLVGMGGNDVLLGGAGDDELQGDYGDLAGQFHGDDELDGGDGNDHLFGQGGSDTLYGGAGDDIIEADGAVDKLAAEFHGNDYVDGGDGNDNIAGGGGDDVLYGGAGDDWIAGEDETEVDSVSTLTGNDRIFGGAGNDTLVGGNGDDELSGDEGDDWLYGGAGNDRLDGGTGSNVLKGGAGDDTYLTAADGTHVISDAQGSNVVEGIDGLVAQATLQGDLVLHSGSRTVVLKEALVGGFAGALQFQGAMVGVEDYIADQVMDSIVLTGNAADQSLVAGRGDDEIFANGAGTRVRAGKGDDQITFNESGGVAVLHRGDGHDRVFVAPHPASVPSEDNTIDVQLGEGIAASDVSFEYDPVANSLKLRYSPEPNDVLEVAYGGLVPPSVVDMPPVGKVHLADGTLLDLNFTPQTVDEDAQYDYQLPADVFAVVGAGAAVSATLSGGQPLPAWLHFDPATRTFSGTPANDDVGGLSVLVRAVDGSVTVAHSFALVVRNVNDAPQAGAALPAFSGNENETWVYDLPEGSFTDVDAGDVLTYTARLADGTPLPSWLHIDPATGQLSHPLGYAHATRLSVIITATDEAGAAAEQPLDLTVRSALDSQAILGTPGDDVLTGTTGHDVLIGGVGNDILDGGAGNDVLIGGNSNGTRDSGEGADTYLFGRGDGDDEIWNGRSDGLDTLKFKSGIKPEDINVHRGPGSIAVWGADGSSRLVPDSIVFTIIDTGETITIPGFHAAQGLGAGGVDSVVFADFPNVSWSPETVSRLALLGSAGDDEIQGYTSDDVLRGNAGNDRLWGEWGNDAYQFGKDDGKDVLYEFANEGTDKIVLDAGILPADVAIVRVFDEISSYPEGILVVRVLTGSTEIRIPNFFQADAESGIESIEFANGTVWDRNYILANAQGNLASADEFTGTPQDDHYIVDHPQDRIIEQADGGLDSVESSVTYTLPEHVENLTLTGVLSINATGNGSDNILIGNGGDNILDWGGGGLDTLQGGWGDDTYEILAPLESIYQWPSEDRDGALEANIVEHPGEGTDTLRTNVFYAELPDNVENLVIPSFVTQIISHPLSQKTVAKYFGNAGNNILDVSAVNSGFIPIELDGGAGNDVLIGSNIGENDWAVYDSAQGSVSISLAIDGAQDTLAAGWDTLENIENLRGSSYADALHGNDGENSIDGGAGADRMIGGGGDDNYYVDDPDDVIVEDEGGGIDTVYLAGLNQYSIPTHVENVDVTRAEGSPALHLEGNDEDNHITVQRYGGDSGDVLMGMGGNDWIKSSGGAHMDGGDGDDWLVGSMWADVFIGGRGNDTYEINGNWGGADVIKADAEPRNPSEVNTLQLTGVNLETLVFRRQGTSLRIHSSGGDGYVLVEDFFNEAGGVSERNPVQWLRVTGQEPSGAQTIDTPQILALVQENQAPVLQEQLESVQAYDGQWFSWQLPYGAFTDDGASLTYSAELEDGSALPGWLNFNQENGALSGGIDANGPETLKIRITATDEEGLSASAILEIAVQVEQQVLEGTNDDDFLMGGGGDDFLYGYEGQDQLQGAGGNDHLEGGADDDSLFGQAGNDTLIGGAGNDFLSGGTGNDVFEYSEGDGQDTIDASDVKTADDTLRLHGVDASQVHLMQSSGHLFLLMSGGDQIALYNYFAADTTIDGEAADAKIDHIVFDNGDDWDQATIAQKLNAAANNQPPTINHGLPPLNAMADTPFSYVIPADTIIDPDAGDSVTYSLTLQGGAALPSWLTFDAATRTLSGTPTAAEAGSLSLVVWGTDNYGHSTGLLASMTVAAGPTAPPSSYTYNYTMPNGQGGITVGGNAPYNIMGNSSANTITGNDGPNVLNGAAGNDTLKGGNGADTYFMGSNSGIDTIVENDATAGVIDILQWGDGVANDQLWFRHVANNLEVSVIGTNNKAIIKDWYSGSATQVEQIWAGDKMLSGANVDSLVNAMASFAVPQSGQTTLPPSYQTVLNPVIAANWQ